MKRLLLFLLTCAAFLPTVFIVSAQKLPNVQKASILAPANIKIDGKADEWQQTFQAYNKSTQIYYTIANDDNYLYVLIRAVDPDVINKIVFGGITFTVGATKKDDIKNISVTYPLYGLRSHPDIKAGDAPKPSADTVIYRARTDSFVRAINNELISKAKEVGISGLKIVTDTALSVYNDEGIIARALFDKKISYTYELGIPLKFLYYLADNNNFYYQIKLNGASPKDAVIELSPSKRFLIVTESNGNKFTLPPTAAYQNLAYPTDLRGEYSLAKKP